jgi:putative ABC transport system permease protein
MLKNFFKIALRNIVRHKAYSMINISGLAVGMACSILILLWVQNELSYDRFHKNASRICRLVCDVNGFKAAITPPGLPEGLIQQIPAIKSFVRVSTPTTVLFETGNRKFEEKKTFYADSSFLDFFSFPLVEGDPATALQHIDGVLITQDMAKKYFGGEDALGKTLRKDNGANVTVTGVLANPPANTHLQFDFIMPWAALARVDSSIKYNVWDNFNNYSYFELDKGVAASAASLRGLEEQIDRIYKKNVSNIAVTYQLQPLTDIHLYSHYQIDLPGLGNIVYVRTFFFVALFILIIACINFMNLATARSARRAREVGVRKVIGALRGQLVRQFLGESLLTSLFAVLLAIMLVLLFLPVFNNISEKKLTLHFLDPALLSGLIGIVLVTGLLSGIYPALFLSAFRPVKVLKGTLASAGGHSLFRNGLVVMQFIISIVLLAGTLVVYKQLNFIRNRDLGFQKENLLYMPVTGDLLNNQRPLELELRRNPLTNNFTFVSQLPSNIVGGRMDVAWSGKDPQSHPVFPMLSVNEDFINVFQMKILNGRSFSRSFKADSNNLIVNETALRTMGMDRRNAVGQQVEISGNKGTIIGVVKDFNFKPVQHPIEPLIMRLNSSRYNDGNPYVVIRTQPGSTEATIGALAAISRELNPAYPFNYNFIDQDLANLYQGEHRLGTLLNIFAALAILISCLGLYGLSAFMAEQRTKEIGLRKVLGASVFNIVYLLSTGFTRLIFLAVLISIPLSWFVINSWLKGFAYHIEVSWIIFVVASLTALLIAWLTVGYESVKAALTNPAKSLRTE